METDSQDKTNPLIEALKSVKAYFLYATLFSAALNVLMLTPILYMLLVYDRVVSSGSMETLLMLTLLLMLLLSSSGGFDLARTRLLVAANVKIERNLRDKVSKAAFNSVIRTGNQNSATQAMADLINIRQFVTGPGIISIMDAPWVLVYIGVMFLFHPYFGTAAIFAGLVMVSLAIVTQKSTGERLSKASAISRAGQAWFANNIKNSEVIYGMGMHQNVSSKNNEFFDLATNEQGNVSVAAGRISAISKAVRQLSQSLLLGLGAYLAVNQEISPGMMIAGSLLLGRALAPIDMMVSSWRNMTDVKGQYARLKELLSTHPKQHDKLQLPAPNGQLSVEGVFVVPPGANSASVKGVAFKLRAGEAMGIIGPSAAGKTSLIRAILGVWPPRAGMVRLDGALMSSWDRDELGSYLGYLPQDIELFSGTIAENICRFSTQNSEKIFEAAKAAGIHQMILNLRDGYDTEINAGSLSAGQRQKIGLARAIYGSPKLIILDEPNSNLDDQGEHDLLNALRKMKEIGSTIIVITHRTSILALVDTLLTMKEGEVISYGRRDDVLREMSSQNSKVTKMPSKA